MLENKVYTIGELASYLRESDTKKNRNEFKPVKGKNVDSEDEKNNKKAVGDILKDTEKASGRSTIKGRDKKDDKETTDYNKTTLDVRLDYDPGDGYKRRIKAQVEGYPSEENKKNSDVKDSGAGVEGGKEWYDMQQRKSKKLNGRHAKEKHAGLKARMFPEEDFENETMFDGGKSKKNESKTMKRLHFKNTQFLSESQMFGMIPESYKTDGNVFIVRDAKGVDYLVECRVDETFGVRQLSVINKMNKKSVNEELDRMRKLYGYKSADTTGSVNEDTNDMGSLLENVRKMK